MVISRGLGEKQINFKSSYFFVVVAIAVVTVLFVRSCCVLYVDCGDIVNKRHVRIGTQSHGRQSSGELSLIEKESPLPVLKINRFQQRLNQERGKEIVTNTKN